MAIKKTGISRDLIIHPGETLSDVINERGITQADLATLTGVSTAHISNIILGKKDISAQFAFALEYALGITKTFWLNLQANYDAELLEYNEVQSITDEERVAYNFLSDIIKYLKQNKIIIVTKDKDENILSLRKALQISNIDNLAHESFACAFRINNNNTIDPYVLGAWVRLCQIAGTKRCINTSFDANNIDELISKLKEIMLNPNADIQKDLKAVMELYGIDFSIVKNFKKAPVQGYISEKKDGTYQIAMTIRQSFADIFWFSLFHELGHLYNGDIGKKLKFIDYGIKDEKEALADAFARDKLLNPEDYRSFIEKGDFDLNSILNFAEEQKVMPFIVIGRLQKERYLNYNQFSNYKVRYKWQN